MTDDKPLVVHQHATETDYTGQDDYTPSTDLSKLAADPADLKAVIRAEYDKRPANRYPTESALTDAILASGVVRDAAEVRAEALAAVEAWRQEWIEATGDAAVMVAELDRVIEGSSSALDAVKAAERERFAPIAEEVTKAAREWDQEVGETAAAVGMLLHTIAAELRARIAREGGEG